MIDLMSPIRNFVLCFVQNNIAYFTNMPLEEQQGIFWDCEDFHFFASPPCNQSGTRHKENSIEIIKIPFLKGRIVPDGNNLSPYEINKTRGLWIISDTGKGILAGTTLIDFILTKDLEIFIPINLLLK